MDTFETTNGERREDPAIRQQEIWADLAARLQQLSAEQRSGPNDRDPVPPATASSTASSGPDLPQADPVDPSTLATLVGEGSRRRRGTGRLHRLRELSPQRPSNGR